MNLFLFAVVITALVVGIGLAAYLYVSDGPVISTDASLVRSERDE